MHRHEAWLLACIIAQTEHCYVIDVTQLNPEEPDSWYVRFGTTHSRDTYVVAWPQNWFDYQVSGDVRGLRP